jgi:hypothetical protein
VTGGALWAVRDDRSLSAHAKLAYLMLWSRRPDIRPSIPTLAADMGVAESTARRAVQELQAAGVIKVTERWTADGDRDSNGYQLMPLGVVSEGHHPGFTGTPPVVSEGHPKTTTSSRQVKGSKERASRRARPAVSRDDKIQLVRRAVILSYTPAEYQELSDGQAVALWYLLISNRRPKDPVAYLMKIFTETPYLDTHLANAGTEETWTP